MRFLHANRYPPRIKCGGRLSLENALEKRQPEKPEAGAIFTHQIVVTTPDGHRIVFGQDLPR
jgi:hypothetical protein